MRCRCPQKVGGGGWKKVAQTEGVIATSRQVSPAEVCEIMSPFLVVSRFEPKPLYRIN